MFNILGYKIARVDGNLKAEHKALESISILRTSLRVSEEQNANKLLFNH
jgi:hypothetical protein